jgi:predicted esterase
MPQFFAACGYVVCASNGMPQKFSAENNLSYCRPVGNYMWIESVCKMVEKVCREWNCDRNEIYVYGESQGGMGALNFIESGAIPVKACVLDSPAISMLYSQLNIPKAIDNLKFFYGFDNAESYSTEKVYGLDPFARNCSKIEDKADYTLINGRYLSSTELDKCTSKRITRCPVKFFLGAEDTTTPAFASQLVYKQLKNAGQLTSCDLYIGVGHCTDQNSKVIGTFSYRDKTYNITKPTVDMALWWARFGGYDDLPTITPLSI